MQREEVHRTAEAAALVVGVRPDGLELAEISMRGRLSNWQTTEEDV